MTKEMGITVIALTIYGVVAVAVMLGFLYYCLVAENKITKRTGETLWCLTFIGMILIGFAVAIFTYNKTHGGL